MTNTTEHTDNPVKSIDQDIETHHKKASEFLQTVHAVLIVALIAVAIYVLPGIAERALPTVEANFQAASERFDQEVAAFETKYQKRFYSVTKDEFEKANKSGASTNELKEAYHISQHEPSPSAVNFLRFLKLLKVEYSKMESLFKMAPFILGAVIAGFLLTYRFHVQAANELALKKIELLAKSNENK